MMTARIDHEYSEREALEQERQVLLKKKQALIAENKKRKDDLASLDKDLEKFIDVSFEPAIPLGENGKLLKRSLPGRETDSDHSREGILAAAIHKLKFV